ncbi:MULTISPECIES: protein-methionine-sulfoxide reductase catalytic subunit MsrP [unclassified Methylophaga]|jgi:sulfoxide reductase catalytic subunit YedY|uniref:protein-methionine-sulfoxide reductase catalytic subunit MsrP n=1 Tax=unclassified Methylophaga TaxID=2629249 RepID=UPI000C5C3EE1|nr:MULTISPECIES: protein-methionine-sulfoxide reductase catalytic subunit MsrP [unclassified Methylophaga]MAL50277.1 protein-methionine-sulfoxide reductase catalytic subunit MsrP [Methylophaga sp.]MAP25731.1 protein-methionine-sulfoxide reductase catalytic subunit MsrP [Methylophaga sp.]MBP25091.1 protein-methionine-sulfoxide reductase catalytic subunit MsrP [Methylophaga sp.]HAD31161.1 protein-methionine-sulfoxide reductase catalytic subunit MsrP [Methylophaga sp.]|tara:strand:- start:2051 stop:3007 length:957 start_codon:yes stop_codon:yes gene_type:complete
MWIRKKHSWDIPESEVTDYQVYLNRRQFINGAAGLAAASAMPLSFAAKAPTGEAFTDLQQSDFSTEEKTTTYESITTYNNFYEFGTDKESPSALAADFPDRSEPWMITVDGECDKPGKYDYSELIKTQTLEERIYRLRCVEGWSMVIPWVGFPLAEILKQAQPNSKAKFVEFTTLYDPEQMPGQRRRVLNWPYREGLRMDEAMHPLTLLAVGLYGREMPGQNGAPIRLVVPWKYGFKSIKSIVRIRFVEEMPLTAWVQANAGEYGFYSNVNPDVNHPRWSQRRERRIGEFLKRETLMFNGYGDEVAELYSGMDLKRYF